MRQTMNRQAENAMITTEEYLRRRNVIRGREPEDENRGTDIHSRKRKEKNREDADMTGAARWGAMMELAALLCI